MTTRVVITGANGFVGRAVLAALRGTTVETIAITRRPGMLPASKVLTCGLTGLRACRAIKEADAVIHLAGALNPRAVNTYYGANVATTAAVVDAVRQSNVKRVVFLSFPGAHEASNNELLRTKAEAERLIWSTRIPAVVFRCSFIVGTPDNPGPVAEALLSRDGESIKVLGTGRQMTAPILIGDVTSAIQMALEKGPGGLFDLVGPDQMTMDELVRMLSRSDDLPIRHLPERLTRFLPTMERELQGAFTELLMKPCIGDPSSAVREFGFSLRSPRSLWERGSQTTSDPDEAERNEFAPAQGERP